MTLENYETVQRWLNAVRADHSGSLHTTRNYLRWFKRFVAWTAKTPDQLIEERKQQLKSDDTAVKRTAEETLRNFCLWLEREHGYKRGTVRAHHGAVKSFYSYNYVPLQLKAPKKGASFGVGTHTRDEIKRLHDVASLRDRAIVLCLAESGMSRADFCRLTYGDVKEDYEQNRETIHLKVIRRKAEVVYDTFIGRSGTAALRSYLEARKRKGETLTPDSPLFPSTRGRGHFNHADSLTLLIRRLGEKAGMATSPHRFRKFFESNMGTKAPSLLVRLWLGHSLGSEDPYFHPSVESQREAYENAYVTIDVLGVTKKPSEDSIEIGLANLSLQVRGKSDAEKKAMIAEYLTTLSMPIRDELEPKIERLLGVPMKEVLKIIDSLEGEKTHASEDEDCQKVISEGELPEYLKKHWHVVCTLPSGKIVISNE